MEHVPDHASAAKDAGRKVLTIIPTYNEAQNISRLLPRVFAQPISGLDVLVVDDGSPDGTAQLVRQLQEVYRDNLFLIMREGKRGLGSAYVAGFKFALARDYEIVVEMDADLSHNPDDLPRLLSALEGSDVAIGSRYITGVNVVNWPLRRLLLSLGGNWYVRMVTGLPVKDCTSGFKAYRREVLAALDLDRIQSDGYAFQIEMKYRAWKKGFRLCEVPIIFVDREAGSSKMSKRIVREAIWMVWKLKLLSLMRRL
ncbi:MAG: polyprenol monophosphomannose synthase [candidate division KSB1 bacterium]|nr:polyprenol monophosphomannose synthase [candidate division KSB1 bacterium]